MGKKTMYSFLALGDSYTIGEAVTEKERWPVQLVNRLRNDFVSIDDPIIIATTGWTTDELQIGIKETILPDAFDIVSLLIGVNNQYRGYPVSQYEKEFAELLDQAIRFAGRNPANVFVVSIPDYGVTPFVREKGMDIDSIAVELDNYNAIAEQITRSRGSSFSDITVDSKLALNDSTLIASDGLHPSGKMYKQWVNEIFSKVLSNLSNR